MWSHNSGSECASSNLYFNFLILEGIETWSGFDSTFVRNPIKWESGYVIPPNEPGLGIEINEELLDKYPYTEDKLHLEMSD